MSAVEARTRAREWGLTYRHLGDAGHINTEAGFGPLPPARQWIDALVRRLERDAALRKAFGNYVLAGESLRAPGAIMASPGFAARVSAAIDDGQAQSDEAETGELYHRQHLP